MKILNRRELWNTHGKDFKNRLKKQSALQKLADLLDTSPNEVQRKLHNLRIELNQEWRKKSSVDIRKHFFNCYGSSILISVSNFSCTPKMDLR